MYNIRGFFAADLTEDAVNKLSLLQKNIKNKIYPVKWVDPHNFHVTIKFLGEVSPERAIEIIKKSEQVFKGKTAFRLSFKGLGVFPNFKNPKVIWIAVHPETESLVNIYNELETELFKIGFSKEKRKFKAHMTLGRIKSNLKINLYDELQKFNNVEIKTCINSISFIKSVLTPKGPVYTPLKTFTLK
ncbi:MAG: 2,3-cyclic 3-phosphodiesterase [Thermosediminibacterales bacterium]|nr:2,3-cyclic 3-phosphodiesterase [Thermosediminibacterales bacterium]MDK2836653.1 2,3-cyclic 3-phosphodiesterase [Thermosediminibacterales bacterium]